jgi:hypothetical protein
MFRKLDSHRLQRNSSTPGNKAQQNYVRSKVNNMIVEQAQDASGVVLGTFPINSIPTIVLFDLGATHSFITDQFVAKHNMPMSPMEKPLLVSSPGGDMKASHLCPQVNLKIMGVDFPFNLVVLKSWGIDVILGMDWLRKYDGVIQCREKSVHLTSPQGDKIEFIATPSPTGKEIVNSMKGNVLEDIKVVNGYQMCFLMTYQVCHLTETLNSVSNSYLAPLLYLRDRMKWMLRIWLN